MWNIFNLLVPSGEMAPYLDYAQGFNLSNRMPLWVKPARKLSVNTTMWAMRTHFEETWCEVAGSSRVRPKGAIGWTLPRMLRCAVVL
eukprot:COSAG01_NODE_28268_length_665_cov_1.005300_2_plen_87_part_00